MQVKLQQEARQLEIPLDILKKAEDALMKLRRTKELKNLRSATTGDDETQLRNAIKEARNKPRLKPQISPGSAADPEIACLVAVAFQARLIDLPPTDVEEAQAGADLCIC